jgi:hypothetical protein
MPPTSQYLVHEKVRDILTTEAATKHVYNTEEKEHKQFGKANGLEVVLVDLCVSGSAVEIFGFIRHGNIFLDRVELLRLSFVGFLI